MYDQKRRQVLKSIAAAGATAAALTTLPAIVSAGTSSPAAKIRKLVASAGNEAGLGIEINLESTLNGFHIRLTNRADAAVTVKHVHPGIVHAEGSTFDLNSVLADANLTVQSGSSVELPIETITTEAVEKAWPTGITVSRPVSVTTQLKPAYAAVNDARKVATNRRFFS